MGQSRGVVTDMTEQQVLYETDGKVGIVALEPPEQAQRAQHGASARDGARAAREPMTSRRPASSCCAPRAAASASASTSAPTATIPARWPWRYDALKFHQRLGISVRCLMTPWTLAQAGDRLGAGPLPWRRLRACPVLRPHHRRRQCRVRRARDSFFASWPGDADADDRRPQARPRAALFRRHDRRATPRSPGAWSTASCRSPSCARRR